MLVRLAIAARIPVPSAVVHAVSMFNVFFDDVRP